MNSTAPKWLTLIAVCFGLFMLVLDMFIVNVALPSIAQDLQADLSLVAWVVSGYLILLGVLPLAMGRLGDIFGRRIVYFVGLLIFVLASAACGLAPNVYFLIVARVVQGLGAAIMYPCTLAIVTQAFPPQQRGLAIGIWSGISGLGVIAGPILGGVLVGLASWRWIFFVNVPVGVLAVAMAVLFVRESRDESVPRTVDWLGLTTLATALTLIVLGFTQGNPVGWGSPFVLGSFVVGIALIYAFVQVERRATAPLIDLSLFRNMTFVMACLNTFLFAAATQGSLPYWSLYMQNYLRLSPIQGGLAFLPMTVVAVVAMPIVGAVGQRLGPRLWLLIFMGTLAALAGALLMLRLTPESTYANGLLPAVLLIGISIGVLTPAGTFAVVSAVPTTRSGLASGTLGMARNMGPAIGVAVLGAVFLHHIDTDIPRQLQSLPASEIASVTSPAEHMLVEGTGAAQEVAAREIIVGLQQLSIAIAILCVGALVAAVYIRHEVSTTKIATGLQRNSLDPVVRGP
jgi:DHA2 family methylenomycin A resistance protein-like MFS transporter